MNKTIELGIESHRLDSTLVAMSKEGIKYTFLGDYPDLPYSYSGADIDLLVDCDKKVAELFHLNGWSIQATSNSQPIRGFIFSDTSKEWIVADIWDKSKIQSRVIADYLLCNYNQNDTRYHNPTNEGLIIWKLYKYICLASLRNDQQLAKVFKLWEKLDKKAREKVYVLLSSCDLSDYYKKVMSDFLSTKDGELESYVWNNIRKKREFKHRNRLVYDGDIKLKAVLKNYSVVKKLLTAMIKKSKYPLPMFGVVGNDGAGKSLFCNSLKRSTFYKTDPVHVNMKRKDPILPLYKYIRRGIKRISRVSMVRYGKKSTLDYVYNLIDFIPFWLIEIGDFFDRYIRYQFCKLWAKAGLGVVLFERYPTDRLRGEYPGPKLSLFPLEQYFPMPDEFIFFDVEPEDSMMRKPEDGHSLEELIEKRHNYLKLMEKIDPVTLIPAYYNREEAYLKCCQSINRKCREKQEYDTKLAQWKS